MIKRFGCFLVWMLFMPILIGLAALLSGLVQQVSAPLYLVCFVLCGIIFLVVVARRDRSPHLHSLSRCYSCRRAVATRLYRYRDGRWQITAFLCQECAWELEGVPVEKQGSD